MSLTSSRPRRNVGIVAGCSGINGGNLVKHLLGTEQWDVIGIGRSAPKMWKWCNDPHFKFVSIDLLNKDACCDTFKNTCFREVQFLFFAAYTKTASADEDVKVNLTMFRNNLDCVVNNCHNLKGVALYTGTKYYGVHLGPYKTPALEDDPRHAGTNFYFDQEDLLRQKQQGQSWKYVVVRPNECIGYSPKSFMNLGVTLAVYASICHEYHDISFTFPGSAESFKSAMDCCCSDFIGEMLHWWATEGDVRSANTVFNISNGDIFRWQHLWPLIANYFSIPYDGPQTNPIKCETVLSGLQSKWDEIVRKYDLVPTKLCDLCSFDFVDFSCNKKFDSIVNVNKLKKAGFLSFRDTNDCFKSTFDELKRLKIIPSFN